IDSNSPKDETAAKNMKYMEKLKSEKDAWKDMYETRKKNLKVARIATSEPLVLNWESSSSFLSDEDIGLLKNKPNYDEIISKCQQIKKMAAVYAHEKHKTSIINNALSSFMEEKIQFEEDKLLNELLHCN
ncbi:hypothetical protein L9F63_006676, partial [Diploptera punctata]